MQGWDLSSSCITITTHPLWVMGGDKFGSSILHFTPRWSMFGLIKEYHSISTLPTSYYKYNEWLDKVEIGYCCVGYKMVTTMCFWVMDGVKVDGLPVFHFWHQDSVSLDWFRQFTPSQPFQYLIISIMNGFARLRLFVFIMYKQHHIPRLFSHGWQQDRLQ